MTDVTVPIGYTADADTWCEDDARKVYGDLDTAKDSEGNEIGAIFPDSEWDTPIHCNVCHVFLENALTPAGYAYVTDIWADTLRTGDVGPALPEWVEFYGSIGLDLPEDYTDAFTYAYAEAMLWANTREEGTDSVDQNAWRTPNPNWPLMAFNEDARREIREDCEAFIRECWRDLAGMDPAQAGHDFALTRNHHGAGFWDRGLGERGDRLTKASHPYGESTGEVQGDGTVILL